MKCITYNNGEAIQSSFTPKSHQNLAVTSVATNSASINSTVIIVSLVVAAHIAFNEAATQSSMVLPAGVWFLNIEKGSTVSVLKLTGSDDGQASVIIPE